MPQRKHLVIAALLALVAFGGAKLMTAGNGDYTVKLVVPSAAQLLQGSPVWINGLRAGSVQSLDVVDGKAVIAASLSKAYAPLHVGTTSQVEWDSVVGERILTLFPGPASGAVIPDGASFTSSSRQVEVDHVLSTLNAPTRAHVVSLIGGLDQTTSGSEADLQATLRSAGPAVNALGEVLQGVGKDGPAIHALVGELNQMTAIAAAHNNDIAASIRSLSALTGIMATQQSQLSATLKELPGTLTAAHDTLAQIPAAGAVTTPLLRDLAPATKRLESVSRNLEPVLTNLRPAVANLRPMLAQTQQLLGTTPTLLDTAHQVLPPIQSAIQSYQPALSFLRPYTPELIGWLTNFGQSFDGYDGQGHFWAATLAPGVNAFDDNPVPNLPTSVTVDRPQPGQVVGQPWTDAQGSPMQ